MFKKAVLIDFQEGDIPDKYFNKLKKSLESYEMVTRDKAPNFVGDSDCFLVKISTKIDKELIDSAPNLKYIGVLSTAYDAIDAKYAREKGVDVCNLGGYSTEAVAEFAIAALLEVVRELTRAKEQEQNQDYSFNKFMCSELKDKVLGVIGAGKIGGRIAEIANGFGMKVKYFSRSKKPNLDKFGAIKEELDKVISDSDYLALALVLNDETREILSKEKLDMIKKDVILVNIAPMELLDKDAVLEKTNRGDFTLIFDHSDDITPGLAKKFLGSKGCIVYPPVAFRTDEANIAKLTIFVENVEKFLSGKPINVVNV